VHVDGFLKELAEKARKRTIVITEKLQKHRHEFHEFVAAFFCSFSVIRALFSVAGASRV
jgi:hypothetical protein